MAKKFFLLSIIAFIYICATVSCAQPSKYSRLSGSPAYSEPTAKKCAKHIIIFIGDGMSLSSETAASRYMSGKDHALVWHAFPVNCFVSTWDIDTYNLYARKYGKSCYDPADFCPYTGYDPDKGAGKPYPLSDKDTSGYFLTTIYDNISKNNVIPAPDSASSATAIFTGHKTAGGRTGWGAGTKNQAKNILSNICEKMRDENKASIGAVTTVAFSHATPASFLCHNPSRENYTKDQTNINSIAKQIILDIRPEVVIGGGHPSFAGTKYISDNLYEYLKYTDEYVFAEPQNGKDGSDMLFESAQKAVRENKKLFGLFGGRDGCLERYHPQSGVAELKRKSHRDPSLKDSVLAALKVLSANPNGFILLTEQGDIDWANHNNDFRWLAGSVLSLDEAVKTAVEFVDKPGDQIDWSNTLIIVTADHSNGYLRFNKVTKQGELPRQVKTENSFEYPQNEIRFYTRSHTNELVGLYAHGCGSEFVSDYEGLWYKNTKIIDNTQIFLILKKAARLK